MKGFPTTPCLGERVSALADGTLPDDVRDRSLAHVAVCDSCRAALDVERLLVDRLHALPDPAPSAALMDRLLALGEPGGPLPPRPGRVAGSPRQPTVTVVGIPRQPMAGVVGAPAGRPEAATRPTRSTRPAGRTSRRSLAVAAAGVLGAGVIAVTALGSSLQASGPTVVPPVDQLVVDHGAAGSGSPFTESVLVRVLTPAPTSGPTMLPALRRVTRGR